MSRAFQQQYASETQRAIKYAMTNGLKSPTSSITIASMGTRNNSLSSMVENEYSLVSFIAWKIYPSIPDRLNTTVYAAKANRTNALSASGAQANAKAVIPSATSIWKPTPKAT